LLHMRSETLVHVFMLFYFRFLRGYRRESNRRKVLSNKSDSWLLFWHLNSLGTYNTRISANDQKTQSQGLMLCLHTKKPQYILEGLRENNFCISHSHLVYFVCFWYVLPCFGVLYQEKCGYFSLSTHINNAYKVNYTQQHWYVSLKTLHIPRRDSNPGLLILRSLRYPQRHIIFLALFSGIGFVSICKQRWCSQVRQNYFTVC
jgi:hypothetical protein